MGVLWGCFRKSHRNAKGVEASVLALEELGARLPRRTAPRQMAEEAAEELRWILQTGASISKTDG